MWFFYLNFSRYAQYVCLKNNNKRQKHLLNHLYQHHHQYNTSIVIIIISITSWLQLTNFYENPHKYMNCVHEIYNYIKNGNNGIYTKLLYLLFQIKKSNENCFNYWEYKQILTWIYTLVLTNFSELICSSLVIIIQLFSTKINIISLGKTTLSSLQHKTTFYWSLFR
jgi:hypothetical protein